MGGSFSKASNNNENGVGTRKKTSSSSSFGRLALGSPASVTGSGRSHTSLSQRRRMREAMVQHDYGSYSSLLSATGSEPGVASSSSPLLRMTGSGKGAVMSPSSLSYSAISQPQQRILSTRSSISSKDIGDDFVVSSTEAPSLAVWIVPALCCAMAYALYNIFIKKGSATINPVLGGVILQLVAAVLGMVLLLVLISREGADEVLIYDRAGIQWAILAGLSVGLAEIVSFFVSSLGVQAMQSIPIIIGGSVMFGTTIGAIFLKEELTYRGWVGVVMISCGISLVGLDDTGEGAA